MVVLSIVLQSLLILYYVFSGSAKVAGAKYWVDIFNNLGLPQWFRVVTGFVQLLGAAVLIVGYWNAGRSHGAVYGLELRCWRLSLHMLGSKIRSAKRSRPLYFLC